MGKPTPARERSPSHRQLEKAWEQQRRPSTTEIKRQIVKKKKKKGKRKGWGKNLNVVSRPKQD